MMKKLVAAIAVAGTTMVAHAATMASDAPRGPDNDPNEIVCISERVTGSRLSTRRVCRTRAEWAEHRAETRKVVEKVQYYKPTVAE